MFDICREGVQGDYVSLRCRVCAKPVLWADSHYIQELDFTYFVKPVSFSNEMRLTREEAEKLR